MMVLGRSGSVTLHSAGAGGRGPSLPFALQTDATAAALSPDGEHAVVAQRNGRIHVVDLASGRITATHAVDGGPVEAVQIADNGNFAVSLAEGVLVFGEAGRVVRGVPSSPITSLFMPDGDTVLAGTRGGRLEVWSVGRGERTLTSDSAGSGITALSGAGRTMVFGTEDGDVFVARPDGDVDRIADMDKPVVGIGALRNTGRILVAGGGPGVSVLDGASGKAVAQFISTETGWVVTDGQGRFDGRNETFEDVVWSGEGGELQVDQLARNYFEPGLLAKAVNPSVPLAAPAPVAISDEIRLPPRVNLTISAPPGVREGQVVTATVTAENASDDTVPEIRLYNNGKRVPATAVVETTSEETDAGPLRKVTYQVSASAGVNAISAQALGWQGVESASVVKSVQASGGGGGTLQLTAVGINSYASSGLPPLTYARSDAQAVSSLFAGKIQTPYGSVAKKLLVDDQAKRASLLAHLTSLSAMQPKDAAVVFLSGHGRSVGGEWFFLPQDASGSSRRQDMERTAISGKQLADLLTAIPAQQILLLIDACQSGAVVNQFEGFEQARILDDVSRRTGVHILTASRADQTAPEFPILKAGLFTYVFLQSFEKEAGRRQADRSPSDGRVTVKEVKAYIEKLAPETALYLQSQKQHYTNRGLQIEDVVVTPVGVSYGEDFVLAR